MSMAMQASQSSEASKGPATLAATRTETTRSARAGKKKLTKSANTWVPDGAGNVGRASSEEASMTRRSERRYPITRMVYMTTE